jgi:hypothetical protein
MKKIHFITILSLAIISFISSCKKEEIEGPGMVAIEFDNRAGTADLELNSRPGTKTLTTTL